jgi:hypothetical protein
MSEWIKIIEKMPRHEEFVLAYNGFNIPIVLQFFVSHHTEETKIWLQQTLIQEQDCPEGMKFSIEDYPYWMTLPTPPEE